jgi:protein-disulfide isomerase
MENLTPAQRVAQLRLDERSARRRRNLVVGCAIAGVLALVITIGLVIQSRRDTTGEAVQHTPHGVTADHGVLVGKKSAPHTVVVYEDFQCPICNEFEKATSAQVQSAVKAGKVNVEYRMVSFLDRASKNHYSSRAANAAFAVLDVAGPEAFQKFHAELFENQPEEGTAGPTNATLIDDAVRAGADRDKVAKLINDGAFDDWVTNATDAMSQHGVNGTPTAFIDGDPAGADPAAMAAAVLKVVD